MSDIISLSTTNRNPLAPCWPYRFWSNWGKASCFGKWRLEKLIRSQWVSTFLWGEYRMIKSVVVVIASASQFVTWTACRIMQWLTDMHSQNVKWSVLFFMCVLWEAFMVFVCLLRLCCKFVFFLLISKMEGWDDWLSHSVVSLNEQTFCYSSMNVFSFNTVDNSLYLCTIDSRGRWMSYKQLKCCWAWLAKSQSKQGWLLLLIWIEGLIIEGVLYAVRLMFYKAPEAYLW